MEIVDALAVGRDALWTGIVLAGPLLLLILVVGVIIGLFQAATSIQEMTLSFVPKLVCLVLALFLLGSWQTVIFIDFFTRLLELAPTLVQ
jgi:flagellar biosynthesis protein FliQ